MEFWRISVKFFDGSVEEFVSERVLVKEWLEYWLRKVSCGVVWVKKGVKCVDELENWDFEEIEYMFYRKWGNRIVWDNWGEEKRRSEREIKIDFGE